MHEHLRRVALTAALVPAFAAASTAQSAPATLPTPQVPELLLPAEPCLAQLRFAADGTCAPVDAVALDGYRSLSPIHQRMLLRLLAEPERRAVAHGCWLTMPSDAVATLFNAAIQGPQGFQPANRWSATATDGGGLQQGDPTTLRYSFVPDGTLIPNGVGEGPGNSNLFATFNAAFPSQATWQNRIGDALQRWGELTGVTYVLEPNDDGAPMFNSNGVVGVRGDVRIGCKFIDGGSNTLAYNYYPDSGDMVFDSGDAGYFANSFNNYRRLFNVTAHEHGHGLGIDHVCPLNQTKLMEPLATTAFFGPQFDDVLTAQLHYGDAFEPNDAISQATDLGTLPNGVTNVTNVSIDGTGDSDMFRITVNGDKLMTVSCIPAGTPYLEGPQVGNCTSGATLDPRSLRNLNLYAYDGTGFGLLAFAASQPNGATETIANLSLTAGSYYIRTSGAGAGTIQPYRLTIDIVDNGDIAAAVPTGTGCGGVTWDALNRPLLGFTQILRMDGVPNPASSIGLVLLGQTGNPNGVDLGPLGAPGCFVYPNTLNILTVFPLSTPQFLYLLPIPTTPALSGSAVWTQGAVLVPPGTNALGALTANAVELQLGTQ